MASSTDPVAVSPSPPDSKAVSPGPPTVASHPSLAAPTADAQNAEEQTKAAGSDPTVSAKPLLHVDTESKVKLTTADKLDEKKKGLHGHKDAIDEVNPHDFKGEVQTNNDLPTVATLRRIENYAVLDRHGKSHAFKSLYSGRSVARRVLIIFVRHFFCGNCQEYLRSLSLSITPEALLRLPVSTFIAIVGCGDPALIAMYAKETNCPFPIYTDPTKRLYDELGMIKSLSMGSRPAYMRKSMIVSVMDSVVQGIKQIPAGLATKAGDQRQIGGEFLFEPSSVHTPLDELYRRIGEHQSHNSSRLKLTNATSDSGGSGDVAAEAETTPLPASAPTQEMVENGDGSNSRLGFDPHPHHEDEVEGEVEEKHVTWCHRMRTTRDHAEIPELMEVLGLDGNGEPIKDKKRWSRALETRKGTGLSMASQISVMKAEAKAVRSEEGAAAPSDSRKSS